MVYRATVKQGQIVLEDGVSLPDGMHLRVEPDEAAGSKPARGSAAAILSSTARWHGPPEEIDRLLAELREMKQAEVLAQQRQPDESL